MGFRINAGELIDLGNKMNGKRDAIVQEMGKEATALGVEGANVAKSILAANGSIATGALYRDIHGRPGQVTGRRVTVEYGPSDDEPAKWVEKGRGPVHARPGGKLKFQIKSRGPYLYRTSVGPAPARPFMKPSIRRMRPIARKRFRDAALRAIEGMV